LLVLEEVVEPPHMQDPLVVVEAVVEQYIIVQLLYQQELIQ
tara:strand:+ start:181 stop:303 length:123 start_codon:yes stop_codon:yes gene_type:complete